MITFVLVFFFGAYMPYVELQYQRENSLSDSVLQDLARLNSLTLQQENLSKSIQNYFDAPTRAAINDYQKLDDYFRKLELIRSEAIVSPNSLPVAQLETLVPTFFVCNQEYHTNITKWVTCNAGYVADGTNKKIINRYQPIARQIEPLVTKANESLNAFSQVAEPLISENEDIISKLPSSIDPEEWKKSISTSLGLMKTLEANSKSVLDFISYNKSPASLAWEILRNPSTFRLAYTDDHRKGFNNIVNLLNQSKSEIKNAMEALSEKFEEVEVPVLGKVPLGLTNAVMVYPAAVGLGCLIYSYYMSQAITKRKILQKESSIDGNKIRNLYPLWVDPLEKNKWIRYGKLILFILLPYLILFIINYLLASNPIKAGSVFGLNEGSVLTASLAAGYLLAAIGTIMVIRRSTQTFSKNNTFGTRKFGGIFGRYR